MQATRFNLNGSFTCLALLAMVAVWPGDARNRYVAKGDIPPAASVALNVPIFFEPNRGQSGPDVKFVARGPGYTLLLNEVGATIHFSSLDAVHGAQESSLAVNLVRSRTARSELQGQDELPSKSSYFVGSDPARWLTGIPNFGRVAMRAVYAGVDLTYHGLHEALRCEFKVAPHARPSTIALEIIGAHNLRLDSQGDVVFTSAQTKMRLRKPFVYQERGSGKRLVSARYLLKANRVTLAIGAYDANAVLFIEPVLSYSGYLRLQEAESSPAHGSWAGVPFRVRGGASAEPASDSHLPVPPRSHAMSKSSWALSTQMVTPVGRKARASAASRGDQETPGLSGPRICKFHLEKETHDTLS